MSSASGASKVRITLPVASRPGRPSWPPSSASTFSSSHRMATIHGSRSDPFHVERMFAYAGDVFTGKVKAMTTETEATDGPSPAKLHPAEHRAYRELYASCRQLTERWKRLAVALDD